MPIELLAIIVPLGIAFVVLVVKFSGLSKSARINDEQEAIALFENDYAGEKHTSAVLLTGDKSAAFVQMKNRNQLGLVEVMGDRFITRILRENDVKECKQGDRCELAMKFNDFTHPSGKYAFDSFDVLKRAKRWIEKLGVVQ